MVKIKIFIESVFDREIDASSLDEVLSVLAEAPTARNSAGGTTSAYRVTEDEINLYSTMPGYGICGFTDALKEKFG